MTTERRMGGGNGRGVCVLLVLGEQRLLDALVAAVRLRRPGAEVLTASGLETDVGPALERAPDVVVLDADLPDRSGLDVLADIRRTSDVPVVLLTAGERQLDAARGRALRADLLLPKPFSTRVLLDFVDQVVSARPGRSTRPLSSATQAGRVRRPLVISALVLLGIALVALVRADPARFEVVRHVVVCDLPPDVMVDQFEVQGWCEYNGITAYGIGSDGGVSRYT